LTWDAIVPALAARRIFVIGNGPSRRRESLQDLRERFRPERIIACNAAAFEGPCDAAVAYDAEQIQRILSETDVPLLVPGSKEQTAQGALSRAPERRRQNPHLYLIQPHEANCHLPDDWTPDRPRGHVSGLLAYCLALRACARVSCARARREEEDDVAQNVARRATCATILLTGMDCAVEPLSEQQALRTCQPDGTPGYRRTKEFDLRRTIPVDDATMPRAWEPQRNAWRGMSTWGEANGIRTLRSLAYGALTFLPVFGESSWSTAEPG